MIDRLDVTTRAAEPVVRVISAGGALDDPLIKDALKAVADPDGKHTSSSSSQSRDQQRNRGNNNNNGRNGNKTGKTIATETITTTVRIITVEAPYILRSPDELFRLPPALGLCRFRVGFDQIFFAFADGVFCSVTVNTPLV